MENIVKKIMEGMFEFSTGEKAEKKVQQQAEQKVQQKVQQQAEPQAQAQKPEYYDEDKHQILDEDIFKGVKEPYYIKDDCGKFWLTPYGFIMGKKITYWVREKDNGYIILNKEERDVVCNNDGVKLPTLSLTNAKDKEIDIETAKVLIRSGSEVKGLMTLANESGSMRIPSEKLYAAIKEYGEK